MFKLFLIIISITFASSCAFDYDESATKRRYSKNFDGKFRNAGKVIARKIRPSESMQAGLPKSNTPNFIASDSQGYNSQNYRDYKIRDQKISNYSSASFRKESNYGSNDVDELYEVSDFDETTIDKNNMLDSGVYSGHFKIGQPYTAFGVSYTPQDYESFEEIGTASWYGSDFHGKKTANGEIYNMGDLTAAHPTLPLPSLIKVTNLQNGKSQTLRVNDRGPFAKNRIIDVSERAAELLGFRNKGTTEVKVELLRDDTDQMLQKLQIKNNAF